MAKNKTPLDYLFDHFEAEYHKRFPQETRQLTMQLGVKKYKREGYVALVDDAGRLDMLFSLGYSRKEAGPILNAAIWGLTEAPMTQPIMSLLDVPCPACGVEAGSPCVSLLSSARSPLGSFHMGRERKFNTDALKEF